MNLDDIRRQIDSIDQELLDLLNRRADLVHEVGVVKKREGLQIYAPEREEALLRRLVGQGLVDEDMVASAAMAAAETGDGLVSTLVVSNVIDADVIGGPQS